MCWESAIPVSSSRAKPSIFLAHRYSVVCVTAEKGKPFAKGARKSRVQGGFLDCARNDSVGNGYLVHHAKKECVGNAFFSYRHPERSPRSFSLAVRGGVFGSEKRETPYRGKTVGGASYKRLSEGGGERVLLLLEMREDIPEKSANIWNCTPFLFTIVIK